MERTERLGRYDLLLTEACFPLSGDSLALGRFATVRRRWKVCDLGCGSGVLGLLLLEREESISLTGVERCPAAAAAARRTFAQNGLTARVVEGDLRDRSLFAPNAFDLVISNPPWFPTGAGKPGGPARSEEGCTLSQVCAAAGYLTRPGGRFALVHRPERLPDLFAALRASGLEPKRLALIQHSLTAAPSAVLVEAVRQGRPGLEVLPTLLQKLPQPGPGAQP